MIALYERLKRLGLPGIVGVDLAGDEINFPPAGFRELFERVRADGLYKATVHAGEVSPPSQIWEAIRSLHADRIGHGTSAIEDPPLQEHLRKEGIALEMCITSNYQTGSWADERNHPIGELYRRGVPVTLNSDDPFIQDTDLTDDYLKAVRFFDFTLEDLVRLEPERPEGELPSRRRGEPAHGGVPGPGGVLPPGLPVDPERWWPRRRLR